VFCCKWLPNLTRYFQCVYFWRHKHKVKFTHCFCSCIDWRTTERRRLRNTDYLAVTKLWANKWTTYLFLAQFYGLCFKCLCFVKCKFWAKYWYFPKAENQAHNCGSVCEQCCAYLREKHNEIINFLGNSRRWFLCHWFVTTFLTAYCIGKYKNFRLGHIHMYMYMCVYT
jgi:hypothetical protein